MPDQPSHATSCVSCGHAYAAHDGAGGTCTLAGCGCTRYWDDRGFGEAMDLGETPAAPIPERDTI